MTACVKNHSKRVALAISASLVGVLSLGAAAPAVAFAQDGVEPLAEQTGDLLARASIKTVVDRDGAPVDADNMKFAYGSNNYPVIKELSEAITGNAIAVNDNFTVTYTGPRGVDFNPANEDNLEIGTYTITITGKPGTKYAGEKFKTTFQIVDVKLQDAVLFDNNTGTDKPVWNANGQNFDFYIDGLKLEDTAYKGGSADYSVKYYKANTSETPANEVDITDGNEMTAGDYVAVLEGERAPYRGSKVRIEFTVAKLDITSANILFAQNRSDFSTNPSNKFDASSNADFPKGIVINGAYYENYITMSFTPKTWGVNGTYEVTVSVNQDDKFAAANMTGSKTVTLDKVTQLVDRTHFTYNDQYGAGVQLSALVGSNKLHVDLSQPGQDPFDPAKIRVTDASGEVLSADKYTVSYTDEYGNPATLEDLSTSGDWKVIVKIDAKANKYEIGSYPQVMELHVTSGKVDVDTDAVFTYDGESVDDPLTLTFDESNHLDKLGAIVKFGDKTLVAGEDYELTAYKYGHNGNKVETDEIKDAGNYQLVITSDKYDLSGDTTLYIKVEPCVISGLTVTADSMVTFGKTAFIPYTGSQITGLHLNYKNAAGETVELPSYAYKIDGYNYDKDGDTSSTGDQSRSDEMVATGCYQVIASLTAEGKANYVFGSAVGSNVEQIWTPWVRVSDKSVSFSDVHATDWFAGSVWQAANQGYIKGIYGTDLFRPESYITRADAVVVLFRMAGADAYYGKNEGEINKDLGSYMTRYSDVDPDAYYARAIAWATKMDIAHGDAGATTFRPDEQITREEFAALMKNYAVATRDYVAAGDDALAEFPDASEVSPWMTEAVAWAAENGVMGNKGELNPTDSIKRAEVAAMAVNYQPQKLTDAILDPVHQ